MVKKFSAIVPVAGAGTRLKPHTNTYPKVLLTVGHKPILGHILDQLLRLGRPKVYLIVGQMGEKIQDYVSRSYPGLEVEYIEQRKPKGLGHAISLTAGRVTGPVFILLGDTILSADMRQFVDFSEDKIGVREVDDPSRFGVVETKGGYVFRLAEKPKKPRSRLAIVGAYSFADSAKLYRSLENVILAGKTTDGEIQLTDALSDMIRLGSKIRPVQIDGWYDCGKPSALLAANRHILSGRGAPLLKSLPGCLIIPPVYAAPDAKVSNSIIGPYVSVGAGAEIRGSVISDTIINENAVIQNVLLENSLIGPTASLSGLKQQVNIGEDSEISFGNY